MNELTFTEYGIMALVAFFFGWSKAGIKGLGIFLVTAMALCFGSKASTGLVMPLLMVGDFFAVIIYRKYVLWKYIKILFPAMVGGIIIGVLVGKDLPEFYFKKVMSLIILISVIIMFWWEKRKSIEIPESKLLGVGLGFTAGFTTMIGNLAGAFSNIYFLIMRLPKKHFIGTAAYLYFINNIFKFPFHLFYWKTITTETLIFNLKVLPFQIIGLFTGVYIINLINERFFRRMILILTGAGAVLMFLR